MFVGCEFCYNDNNALSYASERRDTEKSVSLSYTSLFVITCSTGISFCIAHMVTIITVTAYGSIFTDDKYYSMHVPGKDWYTFAQFFVTTLQ